MNSVGDFPDRSEITFEQAEGLEALPRQLSPKHISDEMRALLWKFIYSSLEKDRASNGWEPAAITGVWRDILEYLYVFKYHGMADEFDANYKKRVAAVKAIIQLGTYGEILGWLQAVMRVRKKPEKFSETIDLILQRCHSAYRVVDGRTIVPLTSEAERESIENALRALKPSKLQGALSHLRSASSELSEGLFADSVRDSIHAVEAVARVITGKDKLSEALAELEKHAEMHQAMKRGFAALYGWTSDEAGIRHPLLEDGDAKVTEADAIFMLGACASFVSLLVAKGRAAKMIE